jgi:hypothetical protein
MFLQINYIHIFVVFQKKIEKKKYSHLSNLDLKKTLYCTKFSTLG